MANKVQPLNFTSTSTKNTLTTKLKNEFNKFVRASDHRIGYWHCLGRLGCDYAKPNCEFRRSRLR